MIQIFSSLNIGIALAAITLCVLACLHLLWKLRFNEQQEATVLRLFSVAMGFMGVDLGVGGLLTNSRNLERVSNSLFALAFIPLVARVGLGVTLWIIIFWVVFWFYPVAESAKINPLHLE